MFDSPKCAARHNVLFDLVLKNVDVGTCHLQYAHKSSLLTDLTKFSATKKMHKNHNFAKKLCMIEYCTG